MNVFLLQKTQQIQKIPQITNWQWDISNIPSKNDMNKAIEGYLMGIPNLSDIHLNGQRNKYIQSIINRFIVNPCHLQQIKNNVWFNQLSNSFRNISPSIIINNSMLHYNWTFTVAHINYIYVALQYANNINTSEYITKTHIQLADTHAHLEIKIDFNVITGAFIVKVASLYLSQHTTVCIPYQNFECKLVMKMSQKCEGISLKEFKTSNTI